MTILFARILACTPSSADVEHCISSNNLLKTNLRPLLSLEIKYLTIYFNFPPPLETWDPREAVTFWISEKQRRKHEDLTTKKETAIKAPYCKGIFEAAQDSDDKGR